MSQSRRLLLVLYLFAIAHGACAAEAGSAAVSAQTCISPPVSVRPKTQVPTPNARDQVVNEIRVSCSSTQPVAAPASSPTTAASPDRPFDYLKLVDLLLKFLVGIAWPVAAVVIAYHFKKELAALLARLKRLKAGAAEAEFERGVDEAIKAAEVDQVAVSQADAGPLRSAAESDPRGAILGSWLEVEQAVFRLMEVRGLSKQTARSSLSVLAAMKSIQSAQALNANYVGLFHDLRVLRNQAAHNYEFNPKPGAVLHYAKLARALANEINRAANSA